MADLEVQEKDGKIYCPLKKAWHVSTPEERVRQYYIAILANKYGYSLEQMDQELKVNNSKRGQGKARADIVIWKSEQDKKDKKAAFIVVECKAENVKVRVEDYYQGFNYASWAHAEFFVTTNEKETKYFNVDPAYLPQKLDEVVAIPTAKDVDDAARIEQIKNQTKLFTRDEFTKTLRACHNIIRNNDKLSPEAAFDEISKLLFMKIRFERDNKGMKVFTKQEYLDAAQNHEKNVRPGLKGTDLYALSYMQFLFRTTKEFFKDDRLFDDKDEINIRENSFIQILEKLETFNLSDTQDDVKGIAFEEFLGTTFRGELGQFFTPRTIVDFMTEILDPQEGEVICDPTCGSGGFLIKAFEYVREKIEADIRSKKDSLRLSIEGNDYDALPEDKQVKISHSIDKMQGKLEKVYKSFKYPSYEISQLQKESLFGLSSKASLTQKDGMIPMLRMPNIVNGEIDCSQLKYLPKSSATTANEPNKWLLKKGDFLINRTNSKELVGKSAIFNLDGDYTYASYLIRYRFDTSLVLPEYVNILFMLPLVRKQIDAVSRQTAGQCNINSDEIGAIRIPVPSIPIQQEIIKKYFDAKDGANNYCAKADECKTNALINFEKEIF